MSGDMPDSWTGKLKALSEEMAEDKSGSLRNATKKSLEDLFRFYAPGDLDESTVLEVIGKSKSPTLSRLRDLNPEFRTKPGAIGKGNTPTVKETLPEAYQRFYDMHKDDDLWWIDPESPDAAKEAHEYFRQEALKDLKEYMHDATDYIPDDPVQITPFVHLRDIFSKRK